MAKNFTQFQEISGTADPQSGLREHNLPSGVDKESAYVVGYVDDQAGGEARFSLQSILLACDKVDIGLHNVTNESKTTMFTSPTFTTEAGSPVTVSGPGGMVVAGDLQVTGALTETSTNYISTSALNCYNDGTATPLRVTQQQNTYDVAQFKSGTAMALHIDENGRVGIGDDADQDHQLTIQHIAGSNPSQAALMVVGSVSATSLINGANIEEMDEKLATIEFHATNWTSLSYVSQKLDDQNTYNQANGLPLIQTGKGFDLLEDGDTYVKILSAGLLAPAPDTGHKASIDWQYDEGLNVPDGNAPLAGEPGYGTWDASYQKLRKIEWGADNTRANSANIDFSQIPDGPWDGTEENTFVKMTSAERVALGVHSSVTGEPGGIRTVSKNLFSGDDGELLTATDIVSAYEEQADYHWSEAKDDEYTGVDTSTRTDGTPGIKPRAQQAVLNQTSDQLPDGDADLGNVTIDSLSASTFHSVQHIVVESPGTNVTNPTGADYRGLTTNVNVGGKILHFHDGVLWKITDDDNTNPVWEPHV
jgi:hypothetical protein